MNRRTTTQCKQKESWGSFEYVYQWACVLQRTWKRERIASRLSVKQNYSLFILFFCLSRFHLRFRWLPSIWSINRNNINCVVWCGVKLNVAVYEWKRLPLDSNVKYKAWLWNRWFITIYNTWTNIGAKHPRQKDQKKKKSRSSKDSIIYWSIDPTFIMAKVILYTQILPPLSCTVEMRMLL